MAEKIYTINEVADKLGMTLKVVRRYVASGELKTSKKNNAYIITAEDFEAFEKYIAEGRDKAHAQAVADTFKPGTIQLDMFAGTEYEDLDNVNKGDKVRITFGSGGAEAEITDKW